MDENLDRLRGQDETPEATPSWHEPEQSNLAAWVALIVLVAVVAAGLWRWAPRTAESPAEAVGRVPAEPLTPQAETPAGLGEGEPDPDLPALDALDGYVRPLLAALSSRPELAALLTSDDLVRRFAVSVEAIARGASPATQVRAVAPRGPFNVQHRDGHMVIDPANYERYDGLVRLVEDLDPEQLARLYGRLGPRLDEAHAELGAGGTFDATMARAIRHLLDTPLPQPQARVRPARGTNYAYVDPRFEGLSAAQRQLLRLGPDRARRVQQRLRAFGIALGIPADQLSGAS